MDISFAIQELSKDTLLIIALPIFIIAVLPEIYYKKYKELNLYKNKEI
jgi:hypothetical protein